MSNERLEGTSEAQDVNFDHWIEAMAMVARHYRLDYSAENAKISSAWNQGLELSDALRSIAYQLGMTLTIEPFKAKSITPWKLPVVVQFENGQFAVIETLSSQNEVGLVYCGDEGVKSRLDLSVLEQHVVGLFIPRPARSTPDSRVDEYVKPYEKNWLRKIVLRDLRPYGHIMLAALIANVLALAGIIFTRQVYDRVIPAESFSTLYVLFSGVMVALLFDFILRRTRVRVTDLLGKRADLRMSDKVFGHALRIKNSQRPTSTGTFISQIRELERIREMMTSTTVTAFSDMPFFILFCFVFWYIAGPLVLVPIVALVLMLLPALMVQRKLKKLANESMRESSLRNAMLVESVQGMDDIKTLQAEPRFQSQWNHYNAEVADSNLRLRYITNTLSVWTHTVVTGVFATVVLFGAPMVMSGDLTTGSLIAASILSSRMLSPMSGLTQVLSKWQQAKVAMEGLNKIMQRSTDYPEKEKSVHRPIVNGDFYFNETTFKYNEEANTPSLYVKLLRIKPGERIAILGRNGAGKSTLLQACSGMLEPIEGELTLDGIRLSHIDPADVRRDVSFLSQNARLFHGTIRENLLMAKPLASDQDLINALELSGAIDFIRKLPDGLDHVVLEGGTGLSGGQKQALLLARSFLRQPNVLLLDEPTASLDEGSEKRIIQSLATLASDKTMLIATHRMALLSLVERIIVVDNGRIVMDDKKNKVLAQLRRKPAAKRVEKVPQNSQVQSSGESS
ncbi:type I secretion system permease/ATPase [Halomonas venusta]|uniref:type I secretion system permease/ATPase n=1 Tax=Vreelandella venusta TaxID=44935 RepID=UPI00295ED638|nr:type I secretion system permease/ATPase [Halomonas venusta]MDW0361717.1 type I secretion system permease/ATPase [Halomonas venusta]